MIKSNQNDIKLISCNLKSPQKLNFSLKILLLSSSMFDFVKGVFFHNQTKTHFWTIFNEIYQKLLIIQSLNP